MFVGKSRHETHYQSSVSSGRKDKDDADYLLDESSLPTATGSAEGAPLADVARQTLDTSANISGIEGLAEHTMYKDSEEGSAQDKQQETSSKAHEFSNKRIILQRFTIYNSSSTMYIVGSNAKETLFRILEIEKDPTSDNALFIIEDRNFFYTRKDMFELLNGLDESIEGGLHKMAQGHGLIGFIKFTQGYFLNLITKSSQVAILGGHFIHHIDETKLIPLDINYKRPEKHSDEERLLSIYKYFDLSKTFYFSYTYDITNSLQTNLLRLKKRSAYPLSSAYQVNTPGYNERFVWNSLLLKPVLENREIAAYEWFHPIIHGFIDQANISVHGKKFYVTIIARRSQYFAGARFLKRGVNDCGNVANEIETEQIVSDMLTSSFHDPKFGPYNNSRYTSYVQYRGSIPLFWTQDLNKLPKPPIEISISDPFYHSSACHFRNLLERYGGPIIVLNLIKSREKTARELKLSRHFENCLKYLNQFISPLHAIQYVSFDMSRHSKKNMDVITPLERIAADSVTKTGFFHNGNSTATCKLQRGVIRTNCIDCLDRTNAAQFIICKEVLAHQLKGLGLMPHSQNLDYDSDIINILTEIFHDHGDTIAVQYGGSNLVNTMDSYRRINQWSSHTRDMLNSIKRIYSNSFMDLIRQEAINLFLGNYTYDSARPKLWELQNDFFLHNRIIWQELSVKTSYTHWYNKQRLINFEVMERASPVSQNFDNSDNWFNECYVPRKYQSLQQVFQFNMNSNSRYFPPSVRGNHCFDFSPFESRKLSKDDSDEVVKPDRNVSSSELSPPSTYPEKTATTALSNLVLLEDMPPFLTTTGKENFPHSRRIRSYLSSKMEKLGHIAKTWDRSTDSLGSNETVHGKSIFQSKAEILFSSSFGNTSGEYPMMIASDLELYATTSGVTSIPFVYSDSTPPPYSQLYAGVAPIVASRDKAVYETFSRRIAGFAHQELPRSDVSLYRLYLGSVPIEEKFL